jgi:uncharacterized membrane protein YfcA
MPPTLQRWLPFALVLFMAGLTLWVVALIVARVRRTPEPVRPIAEVAAVMSVIWFFDTLGIGSFAPSTAYYKLRRLVPDHLIPATLLVASTAPGPFQAALIIGIIEVDVRLLLLCIGAAMLGGMTGAKLVSKIPAQQVRLVMAVGLLVAAAAMTAGNLHLMPAGGTAKSLPPLAMAVAAAASFIFAGLMNFGIGFYAPTLITLSLLGLDPQAAFPVMIGAVTCLCPAAAVPLLKRREIDLRLVTSTALGAIPGILLAGFLVRSLPLETLRWLVVAVVVYAAFMLLRKSLPSVTPTPAAAEPS